MTDEETPVPGHFANHRSNPRYRCLEERAAAVAGGHRATEVDHVLRGTTPPSEYSRTRSASSIEQLLLHEWAPWPTATSV